ncbi:MAG: alpha/beta hydrolase [Bdellovibrionales bacterium]|nr:alpha/beta hydrolase [Bdellovibrionales bacterium]
MKKIYAQLLVVFITILSSSVYADYVPETGIYVKESYDLLTLSEIPSILERFEEESPEKNIIFYIHGRNKNTEEEWESLSSLEQRYNARVIMFHWPSWVSLIVRPLAGAKKTAPMLSKALRYISDYTKSHPDEFAHKRINLITHSMGNVVLREFIEYYYDHTLNPTNGQPLFSTYISTGADVSFTDHRNWFSKIDFAKEKYVLMNNRDIVLTFSYLLDLEQREPAFFKLGLGVRGFPLKNSSFYKMLDPKATYIDLTGAVGQQHRHFESDKPFMPKLFNSLLNEDDFDLKSLEELKVEQDRNIYYLND